MGKKKQYKQFRKGFLSETIQEGIKTLEYINGNIADVSAIGDMIEIIRLKGYELNCCATKDDFKELLDSKVLELTISDYPNYYDIREAKPIIQDKGEMPF